VLLEIELNDGGVIGIVLEQQDPGSVCHILHDGRAEADPGLCT
jgi:hypothetical protein